VSITETAPANALNEWEARRSLEAFDIPFAPCRLVGDETEAVAAARELGFPVAIKVHSAAILHKTEVGGVHLDVPDEQGVRQACLAIRQTVAALTSATLEGYLVQRLIDPGLDLLLGAARDTSFGPYLLLGLGGIWAEVLDDVVAIALPASTEDVLRALDGLRAAPLLHGARGKPRCDQRAVAEIALRLGRYMASDSTALEVDINPLRVFPEGRGAIALDARIVRGARTSVERAAPNRAALEALLNPRGVVVVGVSRDPSKFGARLVNSLTAHGFEGPLWALHPSEALVQGIPAFPSVEAANHRADLAFITLDGKQTAGAVHEVARAGVRAAVVFASGFGESGPEGEVRQAELLAVAREAGVSLLGPNTPGLISDPAKLYGSFVGTMTMEGPRNGDIVLLTQSGSVGSALLGRGWDRGLAFRAWIATGDEADIGIEHLLGIYADDPGARVIGIFAETIRDGARFREAAQRARRAGKRIVAYVVGRSEPGRSAIQSHTGALGGNQRLYDAVFRQDQISRVSDLDEMLDALQALSWCPSPGGRRVAVVSSSGASCGIAADDCDANGLELPPLGAASKARLKSILPTFASANNPLDVTAEIVTRPELMAAALNAVVDGAAYDAVLVTLGTQQGPMALEVARAIVDFQRNRQLPVLVSRLGADSLNRDLLEFYRLQRLPLFSTPTRSARALKHLVQQAGILASDTESAA